MKTETIGGIVLFIVSAITVLIANSPFANQYQDLIHFKFGVGSLQLSFAHWASEFLLAIFFFVVGIELKREVVEGALSDKKTAVAPVAGALGGIIFSGLLFLAINYGTANLSAWATPISTDVAFSIAVFSIFGKRLPAELRTFLLTLAVVNDLIAILVIAFIYGGNLDFGWMLVAAFFVTLFGYLQNKTLINVWFLVPVGLFAWYATLQSGIHATVSGVALGLMMRIATLPQEKVSLGEKVEHQLQPISAFLCVPIFAFTAIGLDVSGFNFADVLSNKLALGILLGFLIGQPIGITTFAYGITKLTKSQLHPKLTWWDVYVVGSLAAIGFTVALLVTQISFETNDESLAISKIAIMISNVLAIVIAIIAIQIRSHFRQLSQ